MNWVSARSRRAAAPHSTRERGLAILAARSKSSRPTAWPSGRRSASLASRSLINPAAAPPRAARRSATASGWSRMSLRSSTDGLLRFGRLLGLDAGEGAHAVIGFEVDDAHAPGVAPLGRDVRGVDPDHLALGGDGQDVVALADLEHADHAFVAAAGLDVDGPLARPPLQSILLERGALAVAAL